MKHGTKELDVLLSVSDLVEMGLTRSMAYSIMKRKDVPALKIGNRKYVRRDKFYEWLDSQEIEKEGEV